MPSKRDEDAEWLLMKDERDARLESNGAFYYDSNRPLLLLPVERMCVSVSR